MPLATRRAAIQLAAGALTGAASARAVDAGAGRTSDRDGGGVMIGLVAAGSIGAGLREGATLAVEEVNRFGGILGRECALAVEELRIPDSDIRAHSIQAARRLITKSGLLAVIGHHGAADASAAALTYQAHNILFIVPSVTFSKLNGHGFEGLFTTIPDNKQINRQMATLAFGLGLRNLAIVRDRTPEGEEQAMAFLAQSALLGMRVTAEQSFRAGDADPRTLLADIRAKPFDTLLIASSLNDATQIVRYVDQVRIQATCLFANMLDSLNGPPEAVRAIGTTSVPLIFPVVHNPDADDIALILWRQTFLQRFGHPGDDWALQGYDAVILLWQCANAVKSLRPDDIRAFLRYSAAFSGRAGRLSFSRSGRLYARPVSFCEIANGVTAFYGLGT